MRYGVLSKELNARGLFSPRPQIPYLGYTFEEVAASLREIRDPHWCHAKKGGPSQPRSRNCHPHTCRLSSIIDSIIDSVDSQLNGVTMPG